MMKAMILAAGRGERMRPLTDNTPKPLLKVNGKALIEYHVENLAKAGFKEIVINHAHLGSQIEDYLGNGNRYGVKIAYSPEQQGALDTGGGIFNAIHLLGDDHFIVVNGDIWTDFPFDRLPLDFKGFVHLVLVDNPAHNPQGDFLLRAGKVLDREGARLTYSGIGMYSSALFSDCKPGPFSIVPLLKGAMQAGLVSGEHYMGYWSDIGTPQRLEAINAWLGGECKDPVPDDPKNLYSSNYD